MFKKIFIINLTILFLSSYLNANIQIKARTAILQDFLSGEILYEKDPDRSIFPDLIKSKAIIDVIILVIEAG